ncbi:hypothetical protein [Nannocystis pusilla]|uniref:Uncharacterized protein n=1 Tax=Nannocystis pusilla TaxID=889268 RepID=A0ABS7TMC7_9BACT|nr:hypothetical protein [Nannocystis pusilla]MBZ5709378.1 hypothetical protein [Nannocystis pusilla]
MVRGDEIGLIMLIDPNSRLFDRVPDLFVSPFPGADSYADDAFQALMKRASGSGSRTVGRELLTRAGGQAWNSATQILWKTKATQAGDLLSDIWSKVSWIDTQKDTIAGVLAEVPFALTTDPAKLVASIASVALDAALDAVTAVPVVGWIVGIVAGIGQALIPLFEGLLDGDRVPPERRAILPWRRYSSDTDQQWVRAFVQVEAAGVDWTPMFSPPTDARPWALADGVDDESDIIGQVLAPFSGKSVAWNGAYGCLPGTFRVAGILQYRGRPQPPHSALRFYSDGTLIHLYGDFTQTGDFYPSLQQLAGTTWQQIAAGGPDSYKVDCVALEKLWRDWFTALYTSAMDQGHGDWLLGYLAREVHGEWRFGASASGVLCAEATDGTTVPLVTRGTFQNGALATPRSRTSCMYSDLVLKGKPRTQSGYLPQKWSRDAKTKEYIAPPLYAQTRGPGMTCVPWPPGELLLSKYRRADDAIVLPAVRAVAQLQRRRLSRSLDCAYVRPDAVGDKPAYAAFRDASLRAHCIEMRKRLLQHPSRMMVEYETAREVDPEYASALKDAGVPTNAIQRGAAKFGLRGSAGAEALDPKAPAPDRPVPPQGGLPFDPDPEQDRGGPGWLGPAVLGGAALATTIAVAVGVARSRRTNAR